MSDINESPEITSGEDYFESFNETHDDDAIVQEPVELKSFTFDAPRTIVLKNGTVHSFRIPSLADEKRKEGIQRTIIITSPAIVNGQNPRQVTVDFSKSQIAYYQDLIESVSGYAFNPGDDPAIVLDAKKVIREEADSTGKMRPIRLASLVPVMHQKAAIGRVYGGKIEVVKPELKDGEREIVVLNTRRVITVKQEFGVEQNDDGSFTDPEYRIVYKFAEPNSQHLSRWEVGCFNGFTVNNPKGGSREERTYNVEACCKLFDSLIDSIDGATVSGMPCDAKNADQLARIPEAIKTQIIAFVMNEVTTNSGN